MKALIVEIQKKSCIAMTSDGQFISLDIPAGVYEIGDELTVDQSSMQYFKQRSGIFKLISKVAAVSAAVVLLISASYFGIQYLRKGTYDAGLALAEAGALEEESLTYEKFYQDSGTGIDSQEAEDLIAAERADISTEREDIPSIFEGSYSLEQKDVEFQLDYKDILISYRVEEKKDSPPAESIKKELFFNFTGNKQNHIFNGNIDAMFNDLKSITTRTVTFIFENFEYGQQEAGNLVLGEEETAFKLTVYGYFE